MGYCGSEYSGSPYWLIRNTTAEGQTLENTDTKHCLEINKPTYGSEAPMVTTCNSADPRQLWRNHSTT
jgi:hypothetical protein